jgi:hypothetical protein
MGGGLRHRFAATPFIAHGGQRRCEG